MPIVLNTTNTFDLIIPSMAGRCQRDSKRCIGSITILQKHTVSFPQDDPVTVDGDTYVMSDEERLNDSSVMN